MSERQYIFKIVLAGDGAVGKTSIRNRFMGLGFQTSHLMTIGADFSCIDKNIVKDELWKFQVWDLAGQNVFQNVRARFYQGCVGALLVFDLTRKETFLNLPNWISEIYKYNGRGVIPLIVLANKADIKDKKSVKIKDVESYVNQLNKSTKKQGVTNYFFETSAKTGLNIDVAFETIGKDIRKRLQ